MKQWEYKIDESEGELSTEQEYLNKMGLQGWELVKVEYSVTRYYRRYIFKREIQ